MQVYNSLQTDNHASKLTPPLTFLQAGCPSCRQTNSVKALKAAIVHRLTGIKMLSVDDEKTTTNETQQNAALAQKSY